MYVKDTNFIEFQVFENAVTTVFEPCTAVVVVVKRHVRPTAFCDVREGFISFQYTWKRASTLVRVI